MDFWERGKRIILTRIVRTTTATPTSPPGTTDTKKAKAFSNGLYKTVFQTLESIIIPFYMKKWKNQNFPEVRLRVFCFLCVAKSDFGESYFKGSMRFFCQGWQRRMRKNPKRAPLSAPYFSTACFVYSEQVG